MSRLTVLKATIQHRWHRPTGLIAWWVPIYVVMQLVVSAITFAQGGVPWVGIGVLIATLAFYVLWGLTVTPSLTTQKKKALYCATCGSRKMPLALSKPFDRWTGRMLPTETLFCPRWVPPSDGLMASGFELLYGYAASMTDCDVSSAWRPLFHTQHDPVLPDIDCVPCLIEMERKGVLTGNEVGQRIAKLTKALQ